MAELREGIIINKRYELRKLIGSGGFGQVWYGFDKELQREVAIKRLVSKGLYRSSSDQDEIMEEARKMAILSHTNIVLIYDILSHDDELVIVMEYLHGGSLQDYLRKLSRNKTWIGISESLRILKSILSGLQAAHTHPQGPIIHKDLKPLNILFNKDFHAKIVDFGLASIGIIEAIKTANPGKWEHEGTFGYKSPEQLKGGQIDIRSDLFNVGLIAYILFVAAHPFIDNRFLFDYKEMIFEPYHDVTVTLGPHLPRGIKKFVLKLLAINPSDRFQTTAEALSELEYVEEAYQERLFSRIIDYYDLLKSDTETGIVNISTSDTEYDKSTYQYLSPNDIIIGIYSENVDANTEEIAEGISLCKRKRFFTQGIFLYEKSGKDFSDLPRHLYNRMEEDYNNCKRNIAREVVS